MPPITRIREAISNFGCRNERPHYVRESLKDEILISKDLICSLYSVHHPDSRAYFTEKRFQNDESFLKEATTLAKYRHQNIIRILGYVVASTKSNLSGLLVEHCPFTVETLINSQEREITTKALWQVLSGVSSALYHLHNNGVVHRNISSSTILLTPFYEPKLCDFSVASEESRKFESVGIPRYWAPENFQGNPFSKKTDVYALGVVLWEMFTRKKALFDKQNQIEQFYADNGTLQLPPRDSSAVTIANQFLERIPDRPFIANVNMRPQKLDRVSLTIEPVFVCDHCFTVYQHQTNCSCKKIVKLDSSALELLHADESIPKPSPTIPTLKVIPDSCDYDPRNPPLIRIECGQDGFPDDPVVFLHGIEVFVEKQTREEGKVLLDIRLPRLHVQELNKNPKLSLDVADYGECFLTLNPVTESISISVDELGLHISVDTASQSDQKLPFFPIHIMASEQITLQNHTQKQLGVEIWNAEGKIGEVSFAPNPDANSTCQGTILLKESKEVFTTPGHSNKQVLLTLTGNGKPISEIPVLLSNFLVYPEPCMCDPEYPLELTLVCDITNVAMEEDPTVFVESTRPCKVLEKSTHEQTTVLRVKMPDLRLFQTTSLLLTIQNFGCRTFLVQQNKKI
eukprot:CAMPEP_0168547654 /NCGR_PEP_ID=MMETSP0413-20121227/4150_1 /TAXON_ID=136452 /ORGANISM="Filamoeba nolandi, Strain NC-AS-23-1" /LENGTH=627 /DNA_ID=CAMNT_0008577919 /DNA_START=28 /DNA_END=1911 /DNA_ORIENTATION=+